jgi:peptide-methionine (S)-S-oxide reductase
MEPNRERETATLAGGCFWCLEAVFELAPGVDRVESGYTGGQVENPTYREVSSGMTGHAEAVRITYDPAVTSFRDLLDIFFTIHDPTTLNRQGADVGTQYRSAIFYHSPEQKAVAEAVIGELAAERYRGTPIVTEVVPAGEFYLAEPEHREYYRRNPNAPYCQVVIAPKVAKFRSRSEG